MAEPAEVAIALLKHARADGLVELVNKVDIGLPKPAVSRLAQGLAWAGAGRTCIPYAPTLAVMKRVAINVAFVQDLITLRLNHKDSAENQRTEPMEQADEEVCLNAVRAALLVEDRAHTARLVRVFARRFTPDELAELARIFDVFTGELGQLLLRLRVTA